MKHKTKEYFIPETHRETFDIIKGLDDRYAFVAGGISINWRGNRIPYLISLEKIIYSEIAEEDNNIVVGAGIKLSDLQELEKKNYPVFKALYESANLVASPQIRNIATLGGNLISHFDFSDTLGFLYLTEPDIFILNEKGEEEKEFKDFLTEKTGRFSFPKNIILNKFIFKKEILNRYDDSSFIKESRVGRDITTINITVLKYKNENRFDISVGCYWTNIRTFKNITKIDQVKEIVSQLEPPKTDNRASSLYRSKILIPLIERSLKKCRKN